MRLGALDYADEILAEVEKSLKQALEVIHNQNMELEDSLGRVINTIYTNRQELKGNAQK